MSIPCKMSSIGEGLADRIGDYLTFTTDGSISGGCLINVTNVDNVCRDKPYQTTWTITLPSAKSAAYAFSKSGLESFTADLSNVRNGERAFDQCLSLSAFNSTLNSLYDGTAMFGGCSLDKESAIRVLNSLPAYSSGTHTLLIGMDKTNENDEDIQTAIDSAEAKGWNVTAEWSYPGCASGYFPALFLESTGAQTMGVPFDIKYKNFEIAHDIGLPSTTTGLYAYGGSAVSAGYGPRYYANYQALCFSQENKRYRGYERGSRHILGWRGAYSGSGSNVTLSLLADGVGKETVTGYYNQYWPTAYNVFSTETYGASVGGRTYSLKINIESDCHAYYIPAIDSAGTPCLYDKITQTPVYSDSRSFIVGLTPQQALALANLPVTEDDTLTISLPKSIMDTTDNVFVPAIKSALDTAEDNNWKLDVQIYDDDLPAGSIPADFLESTGKQWIDTGVKLSNESEVSVTAYLYDAENSTASLYGACTEAGENGRYGAYVPYYQTENGYQYIYGYMPNNSLENGYNHVGVVKIKHTNEGFTVNDSTLNWDNSFDPFTTTGTALLFNERNLTGTMDGFVGRVYNFTIADQTTPQANYVPIITADGVPAMWDYVSKTAKLNDGTDSFIVGLTSEQATKLSNLPEGGGELIVSLPQGDVTDANEVYTEAIKTAVDIADANGWKIDIRTYGDELPGGCVPCEFLESTGTQWLDTNLTLGSESEVSCEYKLVGTNWTTNQYAYGTGDAFNLNAFDLLAYYPSAQELLAYVGGNGIVPNNVSTTAETNTLVQTVLNNEALTINENEIAFSSPATAFESAHSATLFAKGGEDRASGLQIYNFSVSRADTKQCNYTPIITAAGVPAMWDSVTHTAKYNADTTEGAADFVVGLSAENALKLANLPATTGGELTISLPSEVVGENSVLQDSAIFDALTQSTVKGWSFTLQTYDGTAVDTEVPLAYIPALFLSTTAYDQGIYTNHRSINGQTVEIKGRLTGKGGIFGQVNNTTGSNLWLDFALDTAYDSWFFRATSATHLAQYWNSDKNFFTTQDHVYIYDDTNYLLTVDGKAAGNNYKQNYTYADAPLALFGRTVVSRDLTYKIESQVGTRVFYCKITAADGTLEANYVPVIDEYGVPCMFDKVTRSQPFYNEGSGEKDFIIGLTMEQAILLRKLPTVTNKTLRISLPSSVFDADGNIVDADINSAISFAQTNGWNFQIQYYEDFTEDYLSAYFLKFIDNNGSGMNTGIKPTVNTGVWGDIISSSRWVESYSTSSLRWSAPAYGTNTGFFYFSGTWRAMSITADTPYISTLNWKNVRNSYGQVIARVQRLNDGTTKELGLTPIEATATANAQLFYYNNSTIRQVKFSENDKITHDLIPAIDKAGNACMYNKVDGAAFYKSSSTASDYIIGLTVEQARLLYKLPSTGRTIYIALPSSAFDENGDITDADINKAMAIASAKGWNFKIQNY